MEKTYIDSNNRLHIDPRYIGVVIERLLEEKFGIIFDVSVSSDPNTNNPKKVYDTKINASDTTIAEIKEYCKDVRKVLIDFLETYASMNKFGNEAGMQMMYDLELIFQTTNWEDVADELRETIHKCVNNEDSSDE